MPNLRRTCSALSCSRHSDVAHGKVSRDFVARQAQPGEKAEPEEIATWRSKVMSESYEEKDPSKTNRPISDVIACVWCVL